MKAVILAAGRGTRLRPLTDNLPKPMVDFRGAPILQYTLSILPKQVDEVIIVAGYLSDKIINHFGDKFGRRKISYVIQSEPRGTFHALRHAEDYLNNEDFLVVSGDDIYCAKDLEDVVLSQYLSVLASETAQPKRFGICKIGNSGLLESIIEKPQIFCGNLANIGVYKLNKSIFYEPIIKSSTGEELLAPMIGSLAEKQKIEVIKAKFWHPIADIADWQKAQELII